PSRPPASAIPTLFPYTTLFRSKKGFKIHDFVPEYPYFHCQTIIDNFYQQFKTVFDIELTEFNISQLFYMCFLPYSKKCYLTIGIDRKSTRLNSSHVSISYAVFC